MSIIPPVPGKYSLPFTLGQADYDSTQPRADDLGLYDPGHLAFDPVHQRLFAIDAKRKRVLVFDVAPGRLEDGAAALAVLGKPDFTAKAGAGGSMSMPFGGPPSPQPVNAETFWYPNGIEFDPERQLLYLADGGGTMNIPADRILVFDADPARLKNGASAIAAFGALNADAAAARYFGGSSNYPGQFTVRDTRGIALDHEHGRLFATGSFESRLVAFHFPRENWAYDIGANSIQSFATLDAADLDGRNDARTLSSAHINAEGGQLSGTTIYSVTAPMVDPRSQRHSRILISEAAVGASEAVRESLVYLEPGRDRRHDLHLYNPGSRNANVTLVLRDNNGLELDRWQRELPGETQLSIEVETLATSLPEDATLDIESNRDIGITALRRTTNSRGDTLLGPAPLALGNAATSHATVPSFINGGNHASQLVLINPTNDTMQGTISFFDGTERRSLGTESDLMSYHIAPHSTHVIRSDGAGPSASLGHVTLGATIGGLPHASILTLRKSGDTWTNESLTTGVYGQEARFAVDQRPNPVRHGEIDTVIGIINTSTSQATIELSLDGEIIGSTNVAVGEQASLGLGELAGNHAEGLVSVVSSIPVTISAQQVTTNLRAEQIVLNLPALTEISHVPLVINGEGISTEIRLANNGQEGQTGQIEFLLPNADPATATILR